MKKIYVINISNLDMPFEEFESKYCIEDKEGYIIPNQEAIDKYKIEVIDSWGIDAPILYRNK